MNRTSGTATRSPDRNHIPIFSKARRNSSDCVLMNPPFGGKEGKEAADPV